MKRFLKWLGVFFGSVAALVVCAGLYLVLASQRVIARAYDVPLSAFNAPTDHESVRRGERLATIYGCNGCHGHDLAGTDMFDEPGIAHITAPNLTEVVKDYTDAELERVIRHGIKIDGRSTWIMPSAMFNRLSDDDLGAIIAYVRSFPEKAGVARHTELRTIGRIGLLTGRFTPQAAQIQSLPQIPGPDATDPLSHGRYLVTTSCTECHGARLQGSDFLRAPNLAIAAAYSADDFARLMRHGTGLDDRKLGLMAEVAQSRFSHFSEEEVTAIRGYLTAYIAGGSTELP
ncbi:MAG TPA: cytochrome c [Povalibacter sp.]|nr:cytochrome c [Povalibacter sp.]